MKIETKIKKSTAGHSLILLYLSNLSENHNEKPFAERLLEEIGGSRA